MERGFGRVVLVTGPAGSGKSTLANCLADRLNWRMVCEDDYWQRHGWDRDPRTPDQEAHVQAEVVRDVLTACRAGSGLVLEFILYAPPPNPLTVYTDLLSGRGVSVQAIALRPTLAQLTAQLAARGRRGERVISADVRRRAEQQLSVLEPSLGPWGRLVDPGGRTPYQICEDLVRSMSQEGP